MECCVLLIYPCACEKWWESLFFGTCFRLHLINWAGVWVPGLIWIDRIRWKLQIEEIWQSSWDGKNSVLNCICTVSMGLAGFYPSTGQLLIEPYRTKSWSSKLQVWVSLTPKRWGDARISPFCLGYLGSNSQQFRCLKIPFSMCFLG